MVLYARCCFAARHINLPAENHFFDGWILCKIARSIRYKNKNGEKVPPERSFLASKFRYRFHWLTMVICARCCFAPRQNNIDNRPQMLKYTGGRAGLNALSDACPSVFSDRTPRYYVYAPVGVSVGIPQVLLLVPGWWGKVFVSLNAPSWGRMVEYISRVSKIHIETKLWSHPLEGSTG